jgi:hypothetical protein
MHYAKKEEFNLMKKKNILDDLKIWKINGLNNVNKFYKILGYFSIKNK